MFSQTEEQIVIGGLFHHFRQFLRFSPPTLRRSRLKSL